MWSPKAIVDEATIETQEECLAQLHTLYFQCAWRRATVWKGQNSSYKRNLSLFKAGKLLPIHSLLQRLLLPSSRWFWFKVHKQLPFPWCIAVFPTAVASDVMKMSYILPVSAPGIGFLKGYKRRELKILSLQYTHVFTRIHQTQFWLLKRHIRGHSANSLALKWKEFLTLRVGAERKYWRGCLLDLIPDFSRNSLLTPHAA